MLLHAGALTQRCFQHRDACTPGALGRRCFTQRWIWRKELLDPGTFTYRGLYTEMFLHTVVLTHSYVYAVLLHASSFAQRFFYEQGLLHRHTLTYTDKSCTHKYFCTVIFFLDTGVFSHMHARMLFHMDVFKCACFYTEILSHKDTFTKRFSCTEMLSHTEALPHTHLFTQRYQRWIYTEELCAHRCQYNLQRKHLHEELLPTDVFTQTYSYMIPDGGHQFYAKEFSKQVQNENFTTALDDLDALCAKCFCGRKQNVNFSFTAFFFQRSKSMYCKRIRQNLGTQKKIT